MTGVYWDKRNKRWKVLIRVFGSSRWIGNYENEDEAKRAAAAYMQMIENWDNKLLSWICELHPKYIGKTRFLLPTILNGFLEYLYASSGELPIKYITDYVWSHDKDIENTTMEQIKQAERIIEQMPKKLYDRIFNGARCDEWSRNSSPIRVAYKKLMNKPFDLHA